MAYVGTSGWSYQHWEGVLYPRGTPSLARLDWYVGSFRTVELNASFYRWPRDATFASWRLPAAIEFRHPSWIDDNVFALLAAHQTAYVVTSGAGLPCVLRATAPHVYVRLHGPDHDHLYAGSYGEDDLRWWAARIQEWEGAGHDVYAYFNNDGGGHAVHNARRLDELLR